MITRFLVRFIGRGGCVFVVYLVQPELELFHSRWHKVERWFQRDDDATEAGGGGRGVQQILLLLWAGQIGQICCERG